MKVKTVLCLLTIGKMSTVPKSVWPWEVPVLEEKFGGQCQVNSHSEKELDSLPNAESEYIRMQDAYGEDENTKVTHVENAYGRGKAGMSELKKAIAKSVIKKRKQSKASPKKSTSFAEGLTDNPEA